MAKFRCCVCNGSKYLHEGRNLSAKKEYRVLFAIGLKLKKTVDVTAVNRIIASPRSVKACWAHFEQSLHHWLKCDSSDHLCDNEESCVLVQEGVLNDRQKEAIKEVTPVDPFSPTFLRKYYEDEQKACYKHTEKMTYNTSSPGVKFVIKSETEDKGEENAADDGNWNYDQTGEERKLFEKESEPSSSQCQPRKRKQDMSKVYDADGVENRSECLTPITTGKNDDVIRSKDRRCGGTNCACCRFYQKELKKMEEQLHYYQTNWPKTEEIPLTNKVDNCHSKRRGPKINVHF